MVFRGEDNAAKGLDSEPERNQLRAGATRDVNSQEQRRATCATVRPRRRLRAAGGRGAR
jgi:hypothetical protein